MRRAVGQFLSVFLSMGALELRVRETLAVMLSLAIIIAVVVAFGVTTVFLDPAGREKLFPAAIWICFILNAAVSLGRSFEYETEHRLLDGLLLAGVAPASIFISKALVNFVVLSVAHLTGVVALGMLLGVSIAAQSTDFIIISVLVVLAYSALATLVAALTTGSRLRNALLPIILLPLVLPLFFCGVELTTQLALGESFSLGGAWGQMLIGLAVLYVGLGALLFESVVRE